MNPALRDLIFGDLVEAQLPSRLRALGLTLSYEDECELQWLADSPDPRIGVPAIIALGVLGSADLDYLRAALQTDLPHWVLHASIRAVEWGGRVESYRRELEEIAACEELPEWLRDVAAGAFHGSAP